MIEAKANLWENSRLEFFRGYEWEKNQLRNLRARSILFE
jgi:hypothetical protein